MNGLVRNVMQITGVSPSGSARLTNFNPDKILFVVRGTVAFSKTDLSYFKVTMNFKNSVGSGIAISANLPFDIIADLSDYHFGFGMLPSTVGAGSYALDIGKYCLRADDEITFNVDCDHTFDDPFTIDIFALDTKIGKEQLISYKYVSAQASQAYQVADVLGVYGKISSPSSSVYITTDDFFGSNNISELAVIGIGAAFGQAEDMDDFGLIWSDDTGMTQPVTVRAGSSYEQILFKCWNFDVNRIGYERPEFNSAKLLASSIQNANPSKAKCLKYFYG